MSRRGGTSVKFIIVVVCILMGIYGLYLHHDLNTRLKTSDEKLSRVSQQHDSVSAQLQVVYEHKSRLEKSLDGEKMEHKKTRESLTKRISDLEAQHEGEKSDLMSRIDSISQKNKMLQAELEERDLANDKVEEEMHNLEAANEREHEQNADERALLRQEKDNEIGKLNDDIANWMRKYNALQQQLDDQKRTLDASQYNEYRYKAQIQALQAQMLLNQQNQQPQQQQQLPQHQQQQQQQQPQQQVYQQPQQAFQQQNNPAYQPNQQLLPGVQNQQQVQSQQNQQAMQLVHQNQQPVQIQQNQQPALQQSQQLQYQRQDPSLQNQNMQPVEPGALDNAVVKMDQNPDSPDAHNMQINKPGDKPGYFEAKLPENVPANADLPVDSEDIGPAGGRIVNEQVVMPPQSKQHADADPADKKGEGFDFALRHRRDMVYEEEAEDEEDPGDEEDDDADDGVLGAHEQDDDDDAEDDMAGDGQGDNPNQVAQGYLRQPPANLQKKKTDDEDTDGNGRILAPIADNKAEEQFELPNDPEQDADARNSRLAMMNRLKGYINSKGVFKPHESEGDRDEQEVVLQNDAVGVELQGALHDALDNDLKFGLSPEEKLPDEEMKQEHDRLDYQQRELENQNGDLNAPIDRPLLADGLRGRDGQGQDDIIDQHNEDQLNMALGDNGVLDDGLDDDGGDVNDRNKDLFDDPDVNEDEDNDHDFAMR